MSTTLPRTVVPPQSTMPATKGTSIPGAAKDTIVNACRSPSVATSTRREALRSQHAAQALRRSKKRAPHAVALVGHQVRVVAQHQVVDHRDLLSSNPLVGVVGRP